MVTATSFLPGMSPPVPESRAAMPPDPAAYAAFTTAFDATAAHRDHAPMDATSVAAPDTSASATTEPGQDDPPDAAAMAFGGLPAFAMVGAAPDAMPAAAPQLQAGMATPVVAPHAAPDALTADSAAPAPGSPSIAEVVSGDATPPDARSLPPKENPGAGVQSDISRGGDAEGAPAPPTQQAPHGHTLAGQAAQPPGRADQTASTVASPPRGAANAARSDGASVRASAPETPLTADPPEADAVLPEPPAAPGAPLVSDTATSSLPRGMPAFWAAREAATRAANVTPGPPSGQGASTETADAVPDSAGALPAADIRQTAEPAFPDAPPNLPSGGNAGGQHPAPAASPPAAPATLAPATLAPPQLPPEIVAALETRIDRSLDLHLATEDLGGLRLNLRPQGDLVSITLQADRGETMDLLRRHGDLLVGEMRSAGFAGASLSFAGGSGDGGKAPPQPSLHDTSHPSGTEAAPATTVAGLDLRL